MEYKTFIDIRQNVSTKEEKRYSIVSPYYDPNCKMKSPRFGETYIKYFHSDSYFGLVDPAGSLKRHKIHNFLTYVILIIITLFAQFVQYFIRFEPLWNKPNFLSYIVIEIPIIALYVFFSNSVIKNHEFKRFDFYERQYLLSNMMSNNHSLKVKNDVVLNDVMMVLRHSDRHYFGTDKKYGPKYLSTLIKIMGDKKRSVSNFEVIEHYQKELSMVEGLHSIPLALFSLVSGAAVQVLQF